MNEKQQIRYWEIDFFRGLAIILMIIFHFIFDLNYFGYLKLDLSTGAWLFYRIIGASMFFLLVGVSLTISYSRILIKFRIKKEYRKTTKIFQKYLKRGLMIFSLGMLISLVTWYFLKEGYIIFGALHLIGISIILGVFLMKFRFLNLILGIIIISIGISLRFFYFDFSYLLWLGLRPHNYYTVEYFPIFPWFGMVLLGIFLGNLLYSNNSRNFNIPNLSRFSSIRQFCFIGKNSLIIYLAHQPVIIIILISLGIIDINFFI